jgi:FkbM family methyltransferase
LPILTGIARRLRRAVREARSGYRAWRQPNTILHHGVRLPVEAISAEMRRILYGGVYEEREFELLSALLERGDRVLELGSGLGFITVVCAKRCGSDSVTTVEANPHMLDLLRRTFRVNGVSPTLLFGAVSRAGEDQEFFVNDHFWSSSTYDRGGRKVTVPGLRFESLVAAHGPTVIVMDIEGGEVALIGASIDQTVRRIVVELHAGVTGVEAAQSVRAWFTSQGFVATRDWGNRSVVLYERRS